MPEAPSSSSMLVAAALVATFCTWGRTEPLTGLTVDHVTVAVGRLEDAAATFHGHLGFTIKPGRPHRNGIRNAHCKFRDGTELELITADEPGDDLARFYLEQVTDRPEGTGAFVCLRVDRTSTFDRLHAAARTNGVECRITDAPWGRTLALGPSVEPFPVWFCRSKPQVDAPSIVDHANGVRGVAAAWLPRRLWRDGTPCLEALGFRRDGVAAVPGFDAPADVVRLDGTTIYLVDADPDARVVGATLLVDSAGDTLRVTGGRLFVSSRGTSVVLPAAATCGFRLEFLEAR